jgi:hypothetical protein
MAERKVVDLAEWEINDVVSLKFPLHTFFARLCVIRGSSFRPRETIPEIARKSRNQKYLFITTIPRRAGRR